MRTNISTMRNLPCLCNNNPNCLFKLCLGWVSSTRYRVPSLRTAYNPRTLFTTSSSSAVFHRSNYPQNTEQYIHARNLDVRHLHNSHVSRKSFKVPNHQKSASRWNEDEKNCNSEDLASQRSDVGEPGKETTEDTEKLIHRYMV